jgi:hypothetical protein
VTRCPIISIHIPKTAGTAFVVALQERFGERLLEHYGDWVGFNSPEAIARHEARMAEMRDRRSELSENYDVIHGHFIADKIRGSVSPGRFRRHLSRSLSANLIAL